MGPLTEQVKIPQGKTLCFEQNQNSAGPLLALGTTTYALSYDTQYSLPLLSARAAGSRRLFPPTPPPPSLCRP